MSMQPSLRAAVVSESQLVMSAMSRNTRWSSRDLSSSAGHRASLWQAFSDLRTRLSIEREVSRPLDPFLAVLRSPQAGGLVTGVAIASVSRLLSLGMLSAEHPEAAQTTQLLLAAISDCKFEAVDSDADLAVLLKLLHLVSTVAGAGLALDRTQAVHLLESALKIASGSNTSTQVRGSAQQLLLSTVQSLCSAKLAPETHAAVLRMLCQRAHCQQPSEDDQDEGPRMQLLAIWLTVSALEALGEETCQQPEVLAVVERELVQTMIFVARHCNMVLHTLAVVVRGVLWLCQHVAHLLRQQTAQLLLHGPLMLLEAKSVPSQVRQLAFDCFGSLAHIPSFLPELYVNHDCCQTSQECLLEHMMQALHKGVFPVSGAIESTHAAALHAIVATLSATLARLEGSPGEGCAELEAHLVDARRAKLELRAAASVFNANPCKGLEQLPALWPLDEHKAAQFLSSNSFLQKKALGEFFGSRSKIKVPQEESSPAREGGTPPQDFSLRTLSAFIESFEWTGKSFDLALRELLHSFRLPGEAQMIDRIMEVFAAHYHRCNPEAFDCPDTGYTLAFSLMMLNTDLHNNSIKTKMTCASFIKNNRGIGAGGSDLPEGYLSELFDSIAKSEIRMVSEQLPEDLGEFEWNQLVADPQEYKRYQPELWGSRVEALLFGATWSGTVAALSVVMEAPEVPPGVLQVAARGWQLCTELAARLEMQLVLQNVLSLLARSVQQLEPDISRPQMEGLLAGDPAVRLAVSTIFRVAHEHSQLLTAVSWGVVVEQAVLLNRYGHLIPHPKLCELHSEASTPAKPELEHSSSWADLFNSNRDDKESARFDAAQELVQGAGVLQVFSRDSKFLSQESLTMLAEALQAGCTAAAYSVHGTLLCLHLLVEVALPNRDRFETIWPALLACFQHLLSASSSPTTLQCTTTALMRLTSRLAHKHEIASMLFQTIRRLFLEHDRSLVQAVRPQLASGVLVIVQNNVLHLSRSPGSWQLTVDLIALVASPQHAPEALAALEHVVLHSPPLCDQTLAPCLQTLRLLLLESTVPDAAVQNSALQLLLTVMRRLCEQQAGEDSTQWPILGSPVMELLGEACCSALLPDQSSVEALSAFPELFKMGLGSPLKLGSQQWSQLLRESLLPTLHQLQASSAGSPCRVVAALDALERSLLAVLPALDRAHLEPVWRSSLTVLAGFSRLGCGVTAEVLLVLQQMMLVLAELLGGEVCTEELWVCTVELCLASFDAEVGLTEEGLEAMLGLKHPEQQHISDEEPEGAEQAQQVQQVQQEEEAQQQQEPEVVEATEGHEDREDNPAEMGGF